MFNPLSILTILSEQREEIAALEDALTKANAEIERRDAQSKPPVSDGDMISLSCRLNTHENCRGELQDSQGTTHRCECKCHAVGDEQ